VTTVPQEETELREGVARQPGIMRGVWDGTNPNGHLSGVTQRVTRGSVIAAFLVLVLGFVVALLSLLGNDLTYKVDSAWQAYAGLFILAFAVERVIQPFNEVLGDGANAGDTAEMKAKARANTAVVTWSVATALGFVLSALLKAGLLTSIASPTVTPSKWLDVVVTGLVIGAGTKPLHDLVMKIQGP